jgi:hypothetical protein
MTQRDECSVMMGKGATKFDSSGRLLLDSKEQIRERLGFSPDLGDPAALTFAIDFNMAEVIMAEVVEEDRYRPPQHLSVPGAWLGL